MTHLSSELLHVRALGATLAIEVEDVRLRSLAHRAWSACLVSPADDALVVRAPSVPAGSGEPELAAALQELTQLVTRRAITARVGELTMFHAGALCDRTSGATIALVAPGGTGKTTVVTTLGRGRGYVSDETVGVAGDLSIEPYCKPLSVRRSDNPDLKDELAPSDLGLQGPTVQPWLAGMVVLRRDLAPGAQPVVETVDVLEALLLLAPETSSLYRFARPLHHLADLLAAVGGLRLVRYHDAADVEPVVSDVLRRTR